MEKKQYVCPETDALEYNSDGCILSGSGKFERPAIDDGFPGGNE